MITPLPFDSSLFGYQVGKHQVSVSWNEAEFLEHAKVFDLVYIFSKNALQPLSAQIQLVDIKLTFEKHLTLSPPKQPEILPFSGKLTHELLSLALESGTFSRFKTDPNFTNHEFEKLYKLWIHNALQNEEVLTSPNMEAFVSCHVSGEKAQIGLIAVDQTHRGKGWAKKLLNAAEHKAFKMGAKTITVATQDANHPASMLYQKQGYTLIEKVYIYHFWNS